MNKELNRLQREKIFLKKANNLNKEYISFSKVHYINNRTPVTFIDKEYGEFQMTPSNFLKGQDCFQRRNSKISSTKQQTTEWFIEEARKIHGNLYNYSKTVYTGAHNKVIIIDPIYGEFEQEANVHLKGSGHPKRGVIKQAELQTYSTEKFLSLAKDAHPDNPYLDYSNVNYINSKTKVVVTCTKRDSKGNIHGSFNILPTNLLKGRGCPKCGNHLSIAQEELMSFLSQYTTVEKENRLILNGKEIDIYLPELKIGIEYNGCNFHSEKYGKTEHYHLWKTEECNKQGIELIQIFEDEYHFHKDCVLGFLKYLLRLNQQPPTDLLIRIKEISIRDINQFLKQYSLDEIVFDSDAINVGAYANDELITSLSFDYHSNSKQAILTKIGHNWNYISNFDSNFKLLLEYFIGSYNPTKILYQADRRWWINKEENIFTNVGFKLNRILPPDYRYYSSTVNTYKRFTWEEIKNDSNNRYYRIWDCGRLEYCYKI